MLSIAHTKSLAAAADTSLVVAALGAQQKETDAVAMGALAKAHEALAASEARNATLQREFAAQQAAAAACAAVYEARLKALEESKSASEALLKALEAQLRAEREAKSTFASEIKKIESEAPHDVRRVMCASHIAMLLIRSKALNASLAYLGKMSS